MNILFWNNNTGYGGAKTWTADITKRMNERGHNVYLCCPSQTWLTSEAKKLGIECLEYFFDPRFLFVLKWKLKDFIAQKQIEVIHSTVFNLAGEVRVIRDLRVPVVLKIGAHLTLPGFQKFEMVEQIKLITTVSDSIRTSLLADNSKINPDHVRLLREGVCLKTYNPYRFTESDRSELRKSFGIGPDQFVIGCLARMAPLKGHKFLFRSIPPILQKYPNTKFLLIGDGVELDNLRNLAHELQIEDNVFFTGFRLDIPELLNIIDLLVHPSQSEGLPNAIMEAMAMAKPVIATDVGGVPELVDCETGILVKFGDNNTLTNAICELISDIPRLINMGNNARKKVELEFNRDKQTIEFEQILEDLSSNRFVSDQSRSISPLNPFRLFCASIFDVVIAFYRKLKKVFWRM